MTRTCWMLTALLMLAPAATRAQAQGSDDAVAVKLAVQILNKGSALFDTKDAADMAATYTEDAKLFVVSKDQNTGEYKVELKDGRAEIEALYAEVFSNRNQSGTSRNTVTSARLVAPDMLLIQGHFAPDTDSPGEYPFVQVRLKQGDTWRIMSLRLFLTSL